MAIENRTTAPATTDKAADKGTTEAKRKINLPPVLSVRQLADLLKVSPVELIKQFMRKGVMVNINQIIDFDTAAMVVPVFGFEAEKQVQETKEPEQATGFTEKTKQPRTKVVKDWRPRPPVVTIMGHVDHGKTSLLDAIRQTHVTATEAGSITQHIGAYQVEADGHKITFLDTPGHEAFTAMRARGTQVTDIAVLVVAADDGIMPQTVEAINHARAAGVPIVVALNKMDKSNANPDRVKKQLADLGLVIEEWGGDIVCVPVSAKKLEGIKDLLDNILAVAEVSEFQANYARPAEGVVIEAGMDKTRGAVATILVQTGTLKVGDNVVVGDTWGKIKAMFDDKGQRLRKAEPSTPIKIMGLSSVPHAGAKLDVVTDEQKMKEFLQKAEAEKVRTTGGPLTLDGLYAQVTAGQVKELNIILKTDVQGSIEPIRNSLEKLGEEKLKVHILHAGSGSITESDVLLAIASNAIIVGFKSRPEPGAKRVAEGEGIDIRYYDVIYNIIEDVQKALRGMLEPTFVEVIEGRAEVRAVFPAKKKAVVAGVYVTEGKVARDSMARVLRQGKVIADSKVMSLRRFKDDVTEAQAGFEVGVGIKDHNDFHVGDIIELYKKERQ